MFSSVNECENASQNMIAKHFKYYNAKLLALDVERMQRMWTRSFRCTARGSIKLSCVFGK